MHTFQQHKMTPRNKLVHTIRTTLRSFQFELELGREMYETLHGKNISM